MARPLLALALVAALPGCRPTQPTAQDHTAIRAVLDRQKDAWNRGDIDAFMQGYHQRPDIVFTSGGKVRHGFEQTLKSYRDKYVDGDAMGHLEFSEVELQPVGPDGAVALGRWALTETPRAATGVFSLVFTREQGRWGIMHDHSSVRADDPPGDAAPAGSAE